MQGASEQCMHATEIERSPGTPSFTVTTRRRFTPHGISCSFLQAVTQLLHSMQRSESQTNFILAIKTPLCLSLRARSAIVGLRSPTIPGQARDDNAGLVLSRSL